MIYPKEFVPGLNRSYSGHFQNTINFKTFFGHAFPGSYPPIQNRGYLLTHGHFLKANNGHLHPFLLDHSWFVCYHQMAILTAVKKVSYNTYLLLYSKFCIFILSILQKSAMQPQTQC